MTNISKDSILVCLSSSPSNIKVIKRASELRKNKDDSFRALYINNGKDLKDNEKQLNKNIAYAKEMGAEIEILSADDIASEIYKFAKIYNANKIVVGKNKKDNILFHKSLVDKLIEIIEDVDLVIVPFKERKGLNLKIMNKLSVKAFVVSVLILSICTFIGYFFFKMGYHDSNIIMVYILGVLLIALITSNTLCSILSSIISVILFNFCFTFPTMSLSFYDSSYLMTFIIMVIVAFIISTLTNRIQHNAYSSANMAHVSKILLDINQTLQKNSNELEVLSEGSKELAKILNRDIIYYVCENDGLSEGIRIEAGNKHLDESLKSSEDGVAKWVAINGKHAGATTKYLSGAKYLYYAIRSENKIYGVLGVYLDDDRLDSIENTVLLSVLAQMALCIENIKNIEGKNEAVLSVKKEQFRADLLRSISHDLRTPLTSIYGNSEILIKDNGYLSEDKKHLLYSDIYDDSLWLINLVENLLSITRIEDGRMRLKIEPQMIDEVVSEALNHVSRNKKEHIINIKIEDEYLMADMDARLIIQVLINLIDNAIKYTPKNSLIEIVSYKIDDMIYIEIKDDGYGIDDKEKTLIFEKFYTLNNSIADSHRSMGLGLALCKSIIEAHDGNIEVMDNKPHGTIFRFSLKATKISFNEEII